MLSEDDGDRSVANCEQQQRDAALVDHEIASPCSRLDTSVEVLEVHSKTNIEKADLVEEANQTTQHDASVSQHPKLSEAERCGCSGTCHSNLDETTECTVLGEPESVDETPSDDVIYCGTVDLEEASIELMEKVLESLDDADAVPPVECESDIVTSGGGVPRGNSEVYISSDSESNGTVEEQSERLIERFAEVLGDADAASHSSIGTDDVIELDDNQESSERPLDNEHINRERVEALEVAGSKRSQEAHALTPCSSASGHDEEDEEDAPENNVKMFTRSMGEAINERGYSAAFRLPTNLEIRQGEEYQCSVEGLDEWEARRETRKECQSPDRDICVWRFPDKGADEAEIDAYLCLAHEVHETEADEALYILQSCAYSTSAALKELMKCTTVKEIWSDDDISLFLRSFRKHGKKFREIRRWMPHKSMADIINFYYDNKKRLRLGRILDELAHEEQSDSTEESESDESANESEEASKAVQCEDCGHKQDELRNERGKYLCDSCFARASVIDHQRPRGRLRRPRPIDGFIPGDDMLEAFAKFEESYNLANGSSLTAEQSTASMAVNRYNDVFRCRKRWRELEKNIIETRAHCMRMMQEFDREHRQHPSGGIEKYHALVRAQAPNVNRHSQYEQTWNMKETIYAFTAFKCYGKDFKQVAAIVGTKTPNMVKQFYEKFRERIDKAIEQGKSIGERKMEGTKLNKNGCFDSQKIEIVKLQ
ncbi:REST corepressor 1 [Toxocara canis]|uniref:REST corepressor 1 n=1 Tax=Toxocara canis TaxID=6265 RepID=A0A0B2UN75_TOXCA|nr:REST corepressor 1 [Toxocara canis]